MTETAELTFVEKLQRDYGVIPKEGDQPINCTDCPKFPEELEDYMSYQTKNPTFSIVVKVRDCIADISNFELLVKFIVDLQQKNIVIKSESDSVRTTCETLVYTDIPENSLNAKVFTKTKIHNLFVNYDLVKPSNVRGLIRLDYFTENELDSDLKVGCFTQRIKDFIMENSTKTIEELTQIEDSINQFDISFNCGRIEKLTCVRELA
jgi:hypothetical protein